MTHIFCELTCKKCGTKYNVVARRNYIESEGFYCLKCGSGEWENMDYAKDVDVLIT